MAMDDYMEVEQDGYKVVMEQKYDELMYTRRFEKGFCPNIECECEDLDWDMVGDNAYSLTYSERYWKVTCPDCGWSRIVVERIESTFYDHESTEDWEEEHKEEE